MTCTVLLFQLYISIPSCTAVTKKKKTVLCSMFPGILSRLSNCVTWVFHELHCHKPQLHMLQCMHIACCSPSSCHILLFFEVVLYVRDVQQWFYYSMNKALNIYKVTMRRSRQDLHIYSNTSNIVLLACIINILCLISGKYFVSPSCLCGHVSYY